MKFLADESVDKPIVKRIREDGHSDEDVFRYANQESALLLTSDQKDSLIRRIERGIL